MLVKKLETLGASLLSRFVPHVAADASEQWCRTMNFPQCYQCKQICGYNAACDAYCCNSAYNCGRINCYC